LTGQADFFLNHLAILFIPLFLETIILQTSCFWISILGLLINGERMIPQELIGMFICFLCLIMIASKGSEDTQDLDSLMYTPNYTIGIILGFSSAWLYAFCCVFNRVLWDVPTELVLFYHGVIGSIFAITMSLLTPLVNSKGGSYSQGITLFQHSGSQYLVMVAASLLDSLGMFANTYAFQVEDSAFVSLVSYLLILYALLQDLVIFNENFSA
jgi:drug/metabolite transporter (DMT)-like permease